MKHQCDFQKQNDKSDLLKRNNYVQKVNCYDIKTLIKYLVNLHILII